MLPTSTTASQIAAAIDDDTTIPAPLALAGSPGPGTTPLADEIASTRKALLESMAREHLALCLMVKRFPDQVESLDEHEADCVARLVAYATSALAALPGKPPPYPASWDCSAAHDMRAALFLHRAAPQVTEAAVCRALARRLLCEIGAAGPDGLPADAGLLKARAAGLSRRLGVRIPEACVLATDAVTGTVGARGDTTLLGQTLWQAGRPADAATEAAPVAMRLPGPSSRQLRIDAQEWVRIVGPDRQEASVRAADLALIDQAEGRRSRLTTRERERVALTVIDSAQPLELMAFPAGWVGSSRVAAALLQRLDDDAMSRWMAGQALTQRPDVAARIAAASVLAWRHGLVAGNVDSLGQATVWKSLTEKPRQWHDERCLTWASCLGDAGRVHAITAGVLGGIGKGMTADEALSILWRTEDVLPPLANGHGHRCAAAFLDALAPALRDGRLSAEQVTRLLGGGTPTRAGVGLGSVFIDGYCGEARQFLAALRQCQGPDGLSAEQQGRIITGTVHGRPPPRLSFTLQTVMKGSPTDIADWYAEILALWRTQRMPDQDARRLMLGLDRDGWSAWHAALRREPRGSDAAVVLALVEAWAVAIQQNLLPRGSLRDGLLSQSPRTRQCELARAAANTDTRRLSELFRRLGELNRLGVLPAADLVEILDATVDVDGLTQAVAAEYPHLDTTRRAGWRRIAAQRQLMSFERVLNECLEAEALDSASAARLLLARPDGRTSRSVRAAGMAGGHSDSHVRLLDDAERRGDLSATQKADALTAAGRLALANPEHGSPPVAEGG
ncbi:hypothetical protein [Roseateles noduli]|uniref:hypothetical protein n=1 Tax=Roseateles noduli TaxID=2052484 RepID=UPI003D64C37D